MDNEILTVEEAAGLLKVAPEIVVNLLSSSELAGRKVGGEWRTTKRALVSFVDGVPLQVACCTPDMCCIPDPAMTAPNSRTASGRCCT